LLFHCTAFTLLRIFHDVEREYTLCPGVRWSGALDDKFAFAPTDACIREVFSAANYEQLTLSFVPSSTFIAYANFHPHQT